MSSNSPIVEIAARTRSFFAKMLSGEGLKQRALRGGFWLGIGSVSEQASRFIRNLILVRVLAPAAFGTIAIVLSVVTVMQSFTDMGVREALIQNPRGGERPYINAAWWMSFGRALWLWLVVCAAAPWIAKFYNNPELVPLFRVAVSSLLLEGAMSARAYVAMKEMKLNKWAMIFHGGGILGVVFTVVLSFYVRSVWALVLGTCAEALIRCILSYIICPFMPSFRLDRSALRELMKFSRGLFGLALLYLIYMRTDIFVVGKLVPLAALGYYSMAISLAQVPSGFLMNLMGQVAVPAMSHVQGQNERINRILMQLTTVVLVLGLPALVFSFFCGHSVLSVVYGTPYAAATWPLILAALAAVINMANNLITNSFFAAGMPHLHRRCNIAMAAVMVITTYPLVKWIGLAGGQLAAVMAMIVGFGLQLERIQHVTGLSLSRYASLFSKAALASICVALVCLVGRQFPYLNRPLPTIAVGLFGCALAYGLASFIFLRDTALLQRPAPTAE